MIRPARLEDLAAIAQIQQKSPEAAPWDPTGYDVLVEELDNQVVGFLVTLTIIEGESEVLNLAVAPEYRRRGIARHLLQHVLRDTFFLEVRESNAPAREFYKSLGFQEVGTRPEYYPDSLECGIVMKFHS